MNNISSESKRVFRVLFGCAALGLGATILLLMLLFVAIGGEQAGNIIFGYSPAIFIIAFGAIWYPVVNKFLK